MDRRSCCLVDAEAAGDIDRAAAGVRTPECYGPQSVEVTQGEAGLEVTLMTGLAPDAASRVCIESAQLSVTTVTLDSPLIDNVS